MFKRILEVGVAVNSLKETTKRFTYLLAGEEGEIIIENKYDMYMQMVRVGNIDFELMEPIDNRGVIATFLKKRGEGIHHISFEVSNIIHGINWMKKQGVRIINEVPHEIAGLKAVFLYPESFRGVLYELIEGKPTWIGGHCLPAELQRGDRKDGVEAEGIIDVGILVDDLEAASELYSRVFISDNSEIYSRKEPAFRTRTCKIGNVNLQLIDGQINEVEMYRNKPMGLHHVTLKVKDINKAMAFLKKEGINILDDPLEGIFNSKGFFIPPGELGGLLVRLVE